MYENVQNLKNLFQRSISRRTRAYCEQLVKLLLCSQNKYIESSKMMFRSVLAMALVGSAAGK